MEEKDYYISQNEMKNSKIKYEEKQRIRDSYEIEPSESLRYSDEELATIDVLGREWMGRYGREMVENISEQSSISVGFAENTDLQDVDIDHESLFNHIGLFGPGKDGGSPVLRNLLLQYINSNTGVCYVETEGRDSSKLMRQIPDDKKDDVVWIEPGEPDGKNIGFNLLEPSSEKGTDEYEREVEDLSSDLIGIIQEGMTKGLDSESRSIVETIVERLVKSEETYNLVDLASLLKIITGADDSQSFPERLVRLEEEYDQFHDRELMVRVANRGTDGLERVLSYLKEVVRNKATRSISTNNGSNFSMFDAVRQGKVVILDVSTTELPQVEYFASSVFISRFWNAIKSVNKQNPDEHLLCLSDLSNIENIYNITDIISDSQKYRVSVLSKCRDIGKVSADFSTAVNHFDSKIALPGLDVRSQQEVSKMLGDIDSWELSDLGGDDIAVQLPHSSDYHGTQMVRTHYDYPPVRSQEEAAQIVEDSVDKHGEEQEDKIINI